MTELVTIEHGPEISGHFKGELKVGKYTVPVNIEGLNEYIFLAEIEEICLLHIKGACRSIADRRRKDKEAEKDPNVSPS